MTDDPANGVRRPSPRPPAGGRPVGKSPTAGGPGGSACIHPVGPRRIDREKSRTPVEVSIRKTPPKRGWFRKLTGSKILLASLAFHFALAALATLWVIKSMQTGQAKHEPDFQSGPRDPTPISFPRNAKKQSGGMSAPAMSKRITTSAPTAVSIPDISPMARLDDMKPSLAAGMGGMGMGRGAGGLGLGAGGMGGGGTGGGGRGLFSAFIAGMNVKAKKLAVALDASGSVKEYQEAMQAYVKSTFKDCAVDSFKSAGFNPGGGKGRSVGTVVLDFLKSPEHFDTIYIFSDFGETKDGQAQWEEVKKLLTERKVRLYLHVLRESGKEGKINPVLAEVIAFAKKTGGDVKIGPMKKVGESDVKI